MKKFIMNKKNQLVAVVALAATSSGAVTAADYTTEIASAVTDGSGNVTAVIAGVIGIAILGFGVGHVLGWFKR
jgi:hypothetical protein